MRLLIVLPAIVVSLLSLSCSSGPGPYAVRTPSPVAAKEVEIIRGRIEDQVKRMGYTLYEPEAAIGRLRDLGLEIGRDPSRFIYADKDLGCSLLKGGLGCKRRGVLLVFLECRSGCGADTAAQQQWMVVAHSLYYRKPNLLDPYYYKGSTKEGQADADALIGSFGGTPERVEEKP
jgi:hypothetical protein